MTLCHCINIRDGHFKQKCYLIFAVDSLFEDCPHSVCVIMVKINTIWVGSGLFYLESH